MSLGLDHVAIAVANLDQAVRAWREAIGAEPFGPREEIGDQGVREQHLRVGSLVLQLLEPLDDDSPVGRFLEKRGPGLHHVAVRVADLEATLRRMKTAGLRLIDESPRSGSRGTRIAFLHPKATGGVLVELVEDPKGDATDPTGTGIEGREGQRP